MKIVFFILLTFLTTNELLWARQNITGGRYELLSGVRQNKDPKSYWDQKFDKSNYVYGKDPAKFLARNHNYIPANSSVLDVGMGEGRNAVFLARQGHRVTGIDISTVAVKKAQQLAKEFNVRIETVVSPVEKYKVEPNTFDSILCFYYLDRGITDKLIEWLKPGGILIFENYTDYQKKIGGLEGYDSRQLLRPGELLT
ncbi:MAG: class I SAM-dependent methyltransferase, partial [Pseudomonadota bacterium]